MCPYPSAVLQVQNPDEISVMASTPREDDTSMMMYVKGPLKMLSHYFPNVSFLPGVK